MRQTHQQSQSNEPIVQDLLEILKMNLVNGEIGEEEYERKKKILTE